jgi:hypothetical protein
MLTGFCSTRSPFMKTISVLVLLQRNVYVIYVFELLIQSKLEICILWNSLKKGSEIHKKRRCFYLCVMSNAFIFDGFLSMGEICFFVFISKTVEWF